MSSEGEATTDESGWVDRDDGTVFEESEAAFEGSLISNGPHHDGDSVLKSVWNRLRHRD